MLGAMFAVVDGGVDRAVKINSKRRRRCGVALAESKRDEVQVIVELFYLADLARPADYIDPPVELDRALFYSRTFQSEVSRVSKHHSVSVCYKQPYGLLYGKRKSAERRKGRH